MAIRRDRIELEINVNGKSGQKTFGALLGESKKLNKELLRLTPGTEKFRKTSEKLRSVNTRLGEIRQSTRGVRKGVEDLNVLGLKIPGTFRKWLPALGVEI